MEKMTGARFLAEMFHGYGVTHVFHVPAIVGKALVEMETLGIARVVTHGEKAAVYMADGYARACRRPGVCMAQSVGAANLAAGLQDPWLARSPVIAITGRKPALARYRNAYQEIDHHPFFSAVTKYDADVDTVEQLPFLLRQAFREATTGRPGPVHLDLEGYAGDTLCSAEALLDPRVEPAFKEIPAFRPSPDRKDMEELLRALSVARTPVIVAGGGVKASAAEAALLMLAEALSLPVATSTGGKGAIPDDHPLNVGCVGTYARTCANSIVFEADLVIFVGSGTGDQVTNGWSIPSSTAKIVQIDIEPAELGRNYPGALGIAADARQALEMLRQMAAHSKCDRVEWVGHCRQMVGAWRQEAAPRRASESVPILTERLCAELQTVLPSDAILVADTGYSSAWAAAHIELTDSRQSFLRAAGSLGWAFPSALGAKCAAANRPVICFTGDGAFLYHIAELETAARWKIGIVVVVNNNGGYAQSMRGVHAAYGTREGRKEELYRFRGLDFARIAEDMGCVGIRVLDPADLRSALKKALSLAGPVVVDVVTDVNSPAPWIPLPPNAAKVN